jgi:hypothetical protein
MTRKQQLKRIKEMASLAKIYIEDGAPHTAAARLRTLANEAEEWAKAQQAIIDAMMAKP